MDFEEYDNEDGRDQQRVQLSVLHSLSHPADGLHHQAWCVERRGGFKYDANLPPRLVKCGNAVGQRLVSSAMIRVLFAVFEEVAVQLLYVVFRESDLFP